MHELIIGSIGQLLFLNFAVSVSLLRATLILFALLGIHEVVFTVLYAECLEKSARYARNFINLTLCSFQVDPLPTVLKDNPVGLINDRNVLKLMHHSFSGVCGCCVVLLRQWRGEKFSGEGTETFSAFV